jgi:hypothetical protein
MMKHFKYTDSLASELNFRYFFTLTFCASGLGSRNEFHAVQKGDIQTGFLAILPSDHDSNLNRF